MNISITFRHMESSSAVKAYAGEKVSKLQKFLRLPMTAKVTLSIDKLRHVAEARISSGGEHLEAREVSEDMYASIDMIIDKLERQPTPAAPAAPVEKPTRSAPRPRAAPTAVRATKKAPTAPRTKVARPRAARAAKKG
jgi:ribosomal subunit interface protein